eukprot:Opistho-2@85247
MAPASQPTSAVVHPLVLLSVVDHYSRAARDSKKRVVGILLGAQRGGVIDVSNSFAVPFEEDEKDPSVWFLDHNYLDNMWAMFRKVNAKERIIGWYHTGPKLRQNDLEINELIRRFTPSPLLVIIGVHPKDQGLPSDAYIAVEEIHEDGTPSSKTIEHIASEIGAEEAEEVGVEHLLRDIKDSTVGTLAERITTQLTSLRRLFSRLQEIHDYLGKVADGKLPVNHQIVYQLQDIFNLLPNVNVEEMVQSFAVETNDEMLVIYLSSLIRAVIALHGLINNKISNREAEKKLDQPKEEKKEPAKDAKDAKDGKDKKKADGKD